MTNGRRWSAANAETRKMLKTLEKQGCVVVGGARHPKVYTPCGALVVIASSPGGGRAYKNARARFKRLGLDV